MLKLKSRYLSDLHYRSMEGIWWWRWQQRRGKRERTRGTYKQAYLWPMHAEREKRSKNERFIIHECRIFCGDLWRVSIQQACMCVRRPACVRYDYGIMMLLRHIDALLLKSYLSSKMGTLGSSRGPSLGRFAWKDYLMVIEYSMPKTLIILLQLSAAILSNWLSRSLARMPTSRDRSTLPGDHGDIWSLVGLPFVFRRRGVGRSTCVCVCVRVC
jgi:hypothetical protein